MADLGARWRAMANHPTWRWLGPEKGNVHLALAAISNACFDLWAKARGMPLWQLLLSLTPEEVRGWGDSGERCHVAAPAEGLWIKLQSKTTMGARHVTAPM